MQFAQGFARVARPSEELLSELGPLKDLVGTWTGNKGFNLIAVPSGPKSFQLVDHSLSFWFSQRFSQINIDGDSPSLPF